MPLQIESNKEKTKSNDRCESPIFKSKDEMQKSMSHLCYGNLYVMGNLWVQSLKSVLVGTKICLVPKVYAAKAQEPTKPPKMRYKDLPLYQNPHQEYKDFVEEKEKCPNRNERILRGFLLPTVKGYRQDIQENVCTVKSTACSAYKDITRDFHSQKQAFKDYMRDPKMLPYTRGLVVLAAATGFYFGSRKEGYLYRRLFFASVGALTAGWLCFPKETDEVFRNVSYTTAKFVVDFYNIFCNKNCNLKQFGPCEADKPPIPPERRIDKKHECPPPK